MPKSMIIIISSSLCFFKVELLPRVVLVQYYIIFSVYYHAYFSEELEVARATDDTRTAGTTIPHHWEIIDENDDCALIQVSSNCC